jgi:hypothetical protein
MPNREPPRARFTEDAFDLEQTKRGMGAYALAKKNTKKAHRLIRIGRIFLMVISFFVFMTLFYLAMEVIALF